MAPTPDLSVELSQALQTAALPLLPGRRGASRGALPLAPLFPVSRAAFPVRAQATGEDRGRGALGCCV